MAPDIALGDRVRLASTPTAPVLTVATLYLEGADERMFAACSWVKGANHVAFPVSELVPA